MSAQAALVNQRTAADDQWMCMIFHRPPIRVSSIVSVVLGAGNTYRKRSQRNACQASNDYALRVPHYALSDSSGQTHRAETWT